MPESDELKKEVDHLNREVIIVKKDIEFMKIDVADVKKYVSNHLPHQIADVESSIKEKFNNIKQTIESRLKPIETKELKGRAISEFLNHAVKIVIAVAGLVWTVLEIRSHF